MDSQRQSPSSLLQMLPWYVNGTLDAADRARVEEWLRTDPSAAAELAWLQSLQQKVRADEPDVSDEIGLARTLQRIRHESRPVVRQVVAAPSFGERVRAWLDSFNLSPAFAVAALVVVVQAGVILNLSTGEQDHEQVRSVTTGAAVTEGQLLRIAFKPEAREQDIRLLLVTVQGSIESGPGQLGDYYVRVPTAAAADALARMKDAPIVESFQPVDAVPQRGH
jgi:anti-sigma factor RsiW